jgi:UDP-N-acetylglucosamine--N-acetylmuramyl-(pentapeptide) pyrophosphoryl-undecaprenol N-acetylglucosamine transferase
MDIIQMKKRILICGGGTGGHLYPALAIIEYIKDNYSSCRILLIGTERGLERESISKFNIDYRTVKSCGLVLRGSVFIKIFNTVKFLLLFISGFFQSIKIVLEFKPDIILGMGGYICGPVLSAGIVTGKKIALHEQNYIPGRLNSLFSRFAGYIFTSFRDTDKYLKVSKGKVIFTGNPLRKAIRRLKETNPDFRKWGLEEGRFTITAFGGSLGAEKINDVVFDLYYYFKQSSRVQILLICGRRFYDKLIREKRGILKGEGKLIFKIFPYIKEIHEIYRISDIIISRAGANTISEIKEVDIPSILIPYPGAVADHQLYNANFLASKGKAVLIKDYDLNKKKMFEVVNSFLIDNGKKYKEMKKRKIRDKGVDSLKIIVSKLMEN